MAAAAMASVPDPDGAGDFVPPIDHKFCDSFIGFSKVVQVYLDTTFQTPSILKKLHLAGDDIATAFKLIHDLPVVRNIVITRATMFKNEYDARQLNGEGEALITMQKFAEALVKFNGSVLVGLPGTRELAEGYAGRGRCLYYLRDYHAALQNFKAAFAIYPRKSPSDVDDEYGNLTRFRNESEKYIARDIMLNASSVTGPPPLDPTGQEGFMPQDSMYFPQTMCMPPPQRDWRLKSTDKAQIRRNNARGRHLVANVDLFPGDVVVDELPVSMMIFTRNWEDHCQRCVMRISRPIPCPKCSAVAYCSENCRQLDLGVHQTECGIARNLHGCHQADFNIHMVYRLIRRIPLPTLVFPPWKRKMESKDPIEVITQEPSLHPDLAMLLHFRALTLGRRHLEDCRVYLKYVLRACYIMALLAREKPADYAAVSQEDRLFLGAMLVRMLLAADNNYYSYNSLPILPSGEVDTKHAVGAAISASLSFVNHACMPNACVAWGKGRAKLVALRTVKKDEEITVSYRGITLNDPKSVRQKELYNRWGFECNCLWCTQNMAGPEYLLTKTEGPLTIACPNPTCRRNINAVRLDCPSCKLNLRPDVVRIYAATTTLVESLESVKEKHEYEHTRAVFTKHLKLLGEYIWLPCKTLGLIIQAVVSLQFLIEYHYGDRVPSATLYR